MPERRYYNMSVDQVTGPAGQAQCGGKRHRCAEYWLPAVLNRQDLPPRRAADGRFRLWNWPPRWTECTVSSTSGVECSGQMGQEVSPTPYIVVIQTTKRAGKRVRLAMIAASRSMPRSVKRWLKPRDWCRAGRRLAQMFRIATVASCCSPRRSGSSRSCASCSSIRPGEPDHPRRRD